MTDLFSDDDFDIPDSTSDDDFDIDGLRASTARAGSMFDEDMEDVMDLDEVVPSGSSGFSLGNFTPGQKLLLAILLVVDIILVGVGVLVITNTI